jgi:DNA processing protein
MKTEALSNIQRDALILSTLQQVDGVGSRTLFSLLQIAGSPEAIWDASDAFLETHLPLQKKEKLQQVIARGLYEERLGIYERLGIHLVPITHPQYPRLLKEIHDPPPLLYVKGDLSALEGKTLGVVGTRMASEYGKQATEKLVEEVAPVGVSIISGLAAGIDTCAHWAALQHQLPTVAVFGCGLDVIFPSNNRRLSEEIVANGGALISEYPLGTQGSKYTFPQRNRIVAGLSHGILVVEGSVKSGALITARLALEEGRSVFAVPGNIFSPGAQGPLHLIKNGAIPVIAGDDILKDLNWSLNEPLAGAEKNIQQTLLFQDLSEEDRRLLELIPYDPVSIESVQFKSGLSSAQLGECLTMMELDGLIILLPGANVCRK